LDIDEGAYDGTTPRRWEVQIQKAEEARQDIKQRQQAAADERRGEQLEADKLQLVRTLIKHPAGETKTLLRDQSCLRSGRFNAALAALINEGHAAPVEISKGNGGNMKDTTGRGAGPMNRNGTQQDIATGRAVLLVVATGTGRRPIRGVRVPLHHYRRIRTDCIGTGMDNAAASLKVRTMIQTEQPTADCPALLLDVARAAVLLSLSRTTV